MISYFIIKTYDLFYYFRLYNMNFGNLISGVLEAQASRTCWLLPAQHVQQKLGCHKIPDTGKTSVQCACSGSWCNSEEYSQSGLTLPATGSGTGTVTTQGPVPPIPQLSCHVCAGAYTPTYGATDCFNPRFMLTQFVHSCANVPAVQDAWKLHHGNNQGLACSTVFKLIWTNGKRTGATVERSCVVLTDANAQMGCLLEEPMLRARCLCRLLDNCNTDDWDNYLLPLPEKPPPPVTIAPPSTHKPMFSCLNCASRSGNYDTQNGDCFASYNLASTVNCYDLPEITSELRTASVYSAMCATKWTIQADGEINNQKYICGFFVVGCTKL